MIKTARSFKSISLSLLSSVLLFTSAATPALAQQWATSGSNIYNTNTGNVGIGTTSPINTLTVKKDASSAIGPTILLLNSSGGFAAGGALDFANYGTGSFPGARIRTIDQGNYGSSLSFWTKANGADSNPLLERMTVAQDGNVGIGTNTPAYKLDVNGNAKVTGSPASTPLLTVDSNADGKYSAIVKGPNPGLAIQNVNDPATTGLYKFVSSGNAFLLYQNTAAAGDFSTSNNIMTWKAGGNVGLGTSAPDEAIHIARPIGVKAGLKLTSNTSNGELSLVSSDDNIKLINYNTSGSGTDYSNIKFYTDNDLTMPKLQISKNGNIGIGVNSPLYKLTVNGTTTVYGTLQSTSLIHTDGNLDVTGYSTLFGLVTATNGISVSGSNIQSATNDGEVTVPFTVSGWNSKTVTFPSPFGGIPTVVATVKDGGTFTGQIAEVRISAPSSTGFTLRFRVNSLGNGGSVLFNWMAL